MNKIKEFRLRNKMTQQELAIKLDVSLSQIQKLEYDLYYPNTKEALLLAKIFNTTVEELFQIS